jgi:hypothetical protein
MSGAETVAALSWPAKFSLISNEIAFSGRGDTSLHSIVCQGDTAGLIDIVAPGILNRNRMIR